MKDEDLTEVILGTCFEVSNELGNGFLESVYEKALLVALRHKGIHAVSQAPVSVVFRGEVVGKFFADLLVEQKVIIELKVSKGIVSEHLAQTINYLKATGLRLGLLVNFGAYPKAEVERILL